MGTRSLPAVMRPGRGANHPHPPSAYVVNSLETRLILSYVPAEVCQGVTFTFTIFSFLYIFTYIITSYLFIYLFIYSYIFFLLALQPPLGVVFYSPLAGFSLLACEVS